MFFQKKIFLHIQQTYTKFFCSAVNPAECAIFLKAFHKLLYEQVTLSTGKLDSNIHFSGPNAFNTTLMWFDQAADKKIFLTLKCKNN